MGLQTAAMAQQRALDALRQRAEMAGRMGAEDWQRGSQKADAQDAVNKANWGARYSRQSDLARFQMGLAEDKASEARRQSQRSADQINAVARQAGSAVRGGIVDNWGDDDDTTQGWR